MNPVLVRSGLSELVVFCGADGWVICDPYPTSTTADVRAAYEALARSLQKAPLPGPEDSLRPPPADHNV